MQNGTATPEDSYLVSSKTKHTLIVLPYDPATLLLGVYPNELEAYIHTKTCTWIFIAALFIITKTWEQPKCPSMGEWTNWYIQKWNIVPH